jgi:tRNA pseudouridine55 synthase
LNISGIALINKPSGISSFQVVSILKKKLNTKKIGHTGTLDPFAEGVLVLLVGNMTRFFDYFMTYKKSYTAEALFGEERDTEDVTGTVTISSDIIPALSDISEKSLKYSGEITQVPPAYSAVHVNGKRAYQLAREGIKTELKPRKTYIHSFDINSYKNDILNFSVSCSSGTYIRSIARDLARECSSASYLKTLVRTAIGDFKLEDAISPENFSINDLISPYEGIIKMGIETCVIKDEFKSKIFNGQMLDSECFENIPIEGSTAVFDNEQNFLSFIETNGDQYKYHFVIPEGLV